MLVYINQAEKNIIVGVYVTQSLEWSNVYFWDLSVGTWSVPTYTSSDYEKENLPFTGQNIASNFDHSVRQLLLIDLSNTSGRSEHRSTTNQRPWTEAVFVNNSAEERHISDVRWAVFFE